MPSFQFMVQKKFLKNDWKSKILLQRYPRLGTIFKDNSFFLISKMIIFDLSQQALQKSIGSKNYISGWKFRWPLSQGFMIYSQWLNFIWI